MSTNTTAEQEIVYPDSDGMPMADNTLQYAWIVTIMGNLDALFAANPNVFVAGDNLVYPVKGDNTIRQAPDVYVAFGRPKGHRGSYRVWEEGGIFPQVVFEVLSPGNRAGEMKKKRQFYRTYGAEEYYVIDPVDGIAEGWVRDGDEFREVDEMNGFVSPRLGIRFDTAGEQLVIAHPDGRPFQTFQQIVDRAIGAEQSAERQKQEIERLRALLRAANIDPDKPG
jgi:Uma2 family endonuclease